MAPAVIHLHIGSPKTGTTYLQDSLWDNVDALASAGVLLPGNSRTVVSRWVGDLLQWKPEDGALPRTWRRLVEEINAWPGGSVVLSHEHVHRATGPQWDAIVDSFPHSRLEIVLTARDLARSVPAQWQSSVRQRYSWTLGEYAASVAAEGARESVVNPARHFWRRQDTAAILRRFVERLSLEQVRIVTVPPSGADPDELWRRFSRACDLAAVETEPGTVAHESLGAASAEVLRRLNASPAVAELSVADYKRSVNHALSRHTLSPRRGEEPGLTLPPECFAWAGGAAAAMIAEVTELGVEVLGDLDDLRPRPSSKAFVSPEELPAEQLLEAAMAGLGGMSARLAQVRNDLDEANKAVAAGRRQATSKDAVSPGAGQASSQDEQPDAASGVGRIRRPFQRRP